MYQTGMMIQQQPQQQSNMMGQFGTATNNGQVQMMQQQPQQTHLQGGFENLKIYLKAKVLDLTKIKLSYDILLIKYDQNLF